MTMKISAETITILQNFAKFNQHIVIESGNVIRTVNEKKTAQITAKVEEEFPTEIPLHDLSGFLKVVSLFEEPEFEFLDDHVIISDTTGSTQQYQYSEKDDLIYEERVIQFPDADITVNITNDQLGKVIKAAGINGVEDIAIVSGGGVVKLQSLDKENPKRVFSIDIGEHKGDFTVYLKHSKKGNKLTLLPLDYVVEISEHKIIKFSAVIEEVEVMYVMAIETDSEL